MPSSIDPALLARARADFFDALPARIAKIRDMLTALQSDNDWNESNGQHLHRLVHNLVGTASTFGATRLAEVARVLEMALDTVIKSGYAPHELERNSILSALHWLEHTAQQEISAVDAQESSFELEQPKRSSSLIYLVEDDQQLARHIQQQLEFEGYQVRHFDCGDTFVAAIRQGNTHPAAVIMDMVLPEGVDAGARAIRDVRACCLDGVPVIFVSTRADIHSRLTAYKAGASRYLVKPFGLDVLTKILDQLLYRNELEACRVLLIDDDPDMLKLHSAMLTGAGLRVVTESNPVHALDVIDQYQPEVLVLDIHMGEVSGVEIAAVLREDDKYASMPIIFLSAERDVMQQMLAMDQGADDFLVKPVQSQRLIQMVKTRARRARWVRQLFESYDRLYYERERQHLALDEHAIVSIADAKGVITYVNDRFCKISGYNRNELIGQNHRVVKSGLHDEAYYREMWQTIVSGEVWHGTLCNRKKNGELYWVESTIAPFMDDTGKPYQYISIRTDITAIKQHEEKMRLQVKAIEASQNAIVIADALKDDMPLIYANPAFERMTGYSSAELLGKNCRILQGPEREQTALEPLRAALAEGAAAQVLLRNYRKSGEAFWNELSISPVRDEAGKLTHYIGISEDVTEQILANEKLVEQEDRLRRSQIYANIGTWDWNIQTGELYWSERIAPLFGYAEGSLETTYENFLNAVHPDDRQKVTDAVAACVEKGSEYNIEHRCVWPDGTVRWLIERGDVVRAADGKPLHMLGVVQDITSRKAAEIALEKKQQQLLEAQRLALLGNWDADLRTGELEWSDVVFDIFGYDKNETKPSVELFDKSVHPDDVALVEASTRRAEETGTHDVVHRIIRPDGEIRVVHELAKSVFDEHGRLIRLHGTVQDVTADTRIQSDLELFKRVIASSEQGVAITDADGQLIYLNRAAEDLLAGTINELQGVHFAEFIEPEMAQQISDEIMQGIYAKKTGWRGVVPVRNKRGDRLQLIANIGYIFDANGAPQHLFNVFYDYTPELARQAELQQAKELAERANRAKSEFLSSMSHELRTPMNAILGFAQLLQYDSALNNEQKGNLDEILKAGQHLLELINEVLDLAKIEAGKIELSIEPVSVLDLVEECMALVAPIAARYDVSIRQDAFDSVHVKADQVRVKQALLNLLSNAIKYNYKGGRVVISVNTNSADSVRILVKDTGRGIAADQLGQLFQPFSRLPTDDAEIEGTGIGLAITRQLVELMHGCIGVESAKGKGSTFWMELPRASYYAPESLSGETDLPAHSVWTPAAGETIHTVLYVEDNPANLRLIAHVLEKRGGINLLTAHEPALGIELAATHYPDLILLDINLPHMDGYEVLTILRSDERLRNTPIIGISANAMRQDIERAREAGFDDYLTKPIDVRHFIEVVDAALDKAAKPSS